MHEKGLSDTLEDMDQKAPFPLLAALSLSVMFSSCSGPSETTFKELLAESPSIEGATAYLPSPYVTAGDRVYMVGHQDGSFPEIGWHITGEMGGIWDHPIKLMDGFDIELTVGDNRFSLDSASTFVNYPMANVHYFEWPEQNLLIERWQYVPDGAEGIAIQVLIHNEGSSDLDIGMKVISHVDLRPTWLGEEGDMIDSEDLLRFDEEIDTWIAKDSLNPWFTVFGTDQEGSTAATEENPYEGLGISASTSFTQQIASGSSSSWNYTVAGSYLGEAEAVRTYLQIDTYRTIWCKQKRDRYQRLANQSKLTIPDQDLQEAFEWLKYNSDWLVRDVPEIGRGMTAGIPDYPWWFGVDSEYALQGYMAIGQSDVVESTIRLLDSMSGVTNKNGRIIHEMSSNGVVFNPGNINETPQFATLIAEIYRWNGDEDFLKRYYPTVKAGLQWLMDENDADGNLFPDGFGMMEIHGLNSEMIDVAAYTQQAFTAAAFLAAEMGESDQQAEYERMAAELAIRINQDFWSEEFSSYADFIGTDEQALHLIDDAIVRADTLDKPWAIEELRQTRAAILANPSDEPRPFVLHHNWVVNTPMEVGIADPDKAMKALKTAEQFVNPFGVFVTGIDRDESAGSDDGSFAGSKAFSYTGAVMTLPTGVQAIAENNYGRTDQALDYLKRMTRSFSYALPGSMYEVSPDYGMICQAWNIYSFAVPIIRQFFGIQPHASKEVITLSPMMPSDWETASVEQVLIGPNEISVSYNRSGNSVTIELIQTKGNWTVEIFPGLELQDLTILSGTPVGDDKKLTGNRISFSNTIP